MEIVWMQKDGQTWRDVESLQFLDKGDIVKVVFSKKHDRSHFYQVVSTGIHGNFTIEKIKNDQPKTEPEAPQ
jgi:hypothetical protein